VYKITGEFETTIVKETHCLLHQLSCVLNVSLTGKMIKIDASSRDRDFRLAMAPEITLTGY